jgi:hypothetical protein
MDKIQDQDVDKFRDWIYSKLDSILDREYAVDMKIIPECRLNYERSELDSRTGEPYYLFSTTVLEYQENLVYNPEYDLDNDEPEFIDRGEWIPISIEIGVNNNFEVVESGFG